MGTAILIGALTLLAWLDWLVGKNTNRLGVLLGPLSLIAALMAADEVRHMLSQIGGTAKRSVVLVGVLLIVGLSIVPGVMAIETATCNFGLLGWQILGAAAAIGLAFVAEMIGYRASDGTGAVIKRIVESVFVFGYIGVLISFMSALRFIHGNEWGLFAFLSLVICVKFSDSAAYTGGKLFGKHKMAPRLSPGKTIQGGIAAVLGGIAASIFAFFVLAPRMTGESNSTSLLMVVVYGLVVTLAGMVGDLAESLLKRETQCKDSSQWLPGLGGVTDILDSMLAAAPAAFVFWAAGWVGPS